MKKLQILGYMAISAIITLILTLAVPAIAASVEKQMTVYYNDIKIYVDGELITPKDPNGNIVDPFVSEGTTYLPVRAVAEALGKTVFWEGATQSVYIGTRPGEEQYMTDILPAYQTGSENIYEEYSALASGGAEAFSMAGVKYLNGFIFTSTGHFPEKDYAIYNLNGQYSSISGVLAHVDDRPVYADSGDRGEKLQVFLDGRLIEEYALSADMPPKAVSIIVAGGNQLKLVWDTGSFFNGTNVYGIGNPILK